MGVAVLRVPVSGWGLQLLQKFGHSPYAQYNRGVGRSQKLSGPLLNPRDKAHSAVLHAAEFALGGCRTNSISTSKKPALVEVVSNKLFLKFYFLHFV